LKLKNRRINRPEVYNRSLMPGKFFRASRICLDLTTNGSNYYFSIFEVSASYQLLPELNLIEPERIAASIGKSNLCYSDNVAVF